MQDTNSSTNMFERFNQWIQESITVKLFSIGFLVLILLIPASWTESLINERQYRANDVVREVASKWSGSQTISGPILVVPYLHTRIIDKGKGVTEIIESVEKAFFLPETLSVACDVSPETLHRGIFDVVVYESSVAIDAQFQAPDFKSLSIQDNNIKWEDAYFILGINDLRGISSELSFIVNGTALPTEPSNSLGIGENSSSTNAGIVARVKLSDTTPFTGKAAINFNLKGSNRLDFLPVGKTTDVSMRGAWQDPSFDGEFLPASRDLSPEGFTASWKVLHYNRPFAQQWTGSQRLSGSEFGVKLLMPVDQYQKSMRTSKYGLLIIILTFVALLLVEITNKIRIHPFQYILIGCALVIYYTLLLSLSEQLGYSLSYLIASIATVILITLYSSSFLKAKLSILVMLLLSVFYIFIYVIVLQQDFSLLIGSIGLFLVIAALMYFSRDVKWYNEKPLPENS